MNNSEFTRNLIILQQIVNRFQNSVQAIAERMDARDYLGTATNLGIVQETANTIPSLAKLMVDGLYEINASDRFGYKE